MVNVNARVTRGGIRNCQALCCQVTSAVTVASHMIFLSLIESVVSGYTVLYQITPQLAQLKFEISVRK